MRDAGVSIRRNAKAVSKLTDTVHGLMQAWTEDNFTYYEQTMDQIRLNAPAQWVKLYLEAVKLGLGHNTNINININRQQDRENLQALVRTRIPLVEQKKEYTPYEEVKAAAEGRTINGM